MSFSVKTVSSICPSYLFAEDITPPFIISLFVEASSGVFSAKTYGSVWLLKFKLDSNPLMISFIFNYSSTSIGLFLYVQRNYTSYRYLLSKTYVMIYNRVYLNIDSFGINSLKHIPMYL